MGGVPNIRRDLGNAIMATMTCARSKVNTFYGQLDGEYFFSDKLLLTAGVSAHQHLVIVWIKI